MQIIEDSVTFNLCLGQKMQGQITHMALPSHWGQQKRNAYGQFDL